MHELTVLSCYPFYSLSVIFSLHAAIKIIKLLIKKGADVNKANSRGKTSLQYACRSCDHDIVKFLLKNGAACLEGNLDIVKELLASVALVNVTSANGQTALICSSTPRK
jgi:ankyrin repeat protein